MVDFLTVSVPQAPNLATLGLQAAAQNLSMQSLPLTSPTMRYSPMMAPPQHQIPVPAPLTTATLISTLESKYVLYHKVWLSNCNNKRVI